MYLFLMKIPGLQTDPWLWDTRLLETPSTPEVNIFLGQILPNLSLAVDPLALPSLRSLLLGSRFTAGLSEYVLYLDALSTPATRGNSVYDL
jgi:hypothetical protein